MSRRGAIGLFSCALVCFSFFLSVHAAHADITSNLAGWWKFDDGTGTTVTDSSGSSNAGTLVNSAGWTSSAKIGPFAERQTVGTGGSGAYVTTTNTVNGTHKDETYAAWIYPTSLTGQSGHNIFFYTLDGWIEILSSGKLNFHGRDNNDYTYTGATIPANAWTHIAITCSDSIGGTGTATFYINGAQVYQVNNPVICYNNYPTKAVIGGYGNGSYGWTGNLDDVRYYVGRALSASDIAELYAYGSAPAAPQISAISATTTATAAVISWTTDQAASSTVNFGSTPSYGTASTSDALVTAHVITLSGLAPSTTYHYKVASGNTNGTASSSDLTFTTFTVDTTPPVISNVASSTSFTTANVSWVTDELSDSKVVYGTATGSYTMSTSSSALATTHVLGLTGLMGGTTYYFEVISTDSSGNTSTSSEATLVTQIPDVTAPAISAITASTTATAATISWTTDEAASSTVLYGFTSSYGNASTSVSLVTAHSIKLSNLIASTTYHFQVSSADSSGNVSTSSDYTFTTDTTPGITLCGAGNCITFHDGDIIPIVGDSITSIDLYSAYLESYFDLRYPNIHLHFRQTARSGAALPNYTTGGQYMGQVDPLSPTTVELMMTNNGGFTTDQYMSQVQDFFTNYVTTSSAERVILDVPPMNTDDGGYILGQYSAALQSYAQANNIPYSGPVWSYLHDIWAANLASSSPVDIQDGGDTDHMGPPAHLGIAYAYLRGFNADPNVSSATIDASSAQVLSETNATISGVTKTSEGIDFTRLDTRLPMAYDDRSLPIFKIMPQIYDMNRYMLTVTNLDPGSYYVYVDGVPSGVATSDQLASGWNMSTMTSGPIHDQLQEVLGRLRDKEGIDRVTRAVTAPNSGMVDYISNANSCYVDQHLTGAALKTCVSTAVSHLNTLDNAIYAAAQPTAHTFSLRKASGTADTIAPVISNPIPNAPLPQGTATTTLSITTDENATCKYGTIAQTPYIWMPNTFTTTGGTTHSAIIGGLLDGVTYTYYVRCQDSYGNRGMSDYMLRFSVNADPNPIVYYKFDEGSGSTTADFSGNNRTATLLNSPTWVTGKVGPYALSFNATNNAIKVGDISDGDGVGALTASAWVKGTGNFTSSDNPTVVAKYGSGQGPWVLGYNGPSSAYYCLMVNSSGTFATALGPVVPRNDANWHHVDCVYDGTSVTVYTDGVAGGAPGTSNSPALTGVIKDTTYPLCIGSISDNGSECLTSGNTLWNGTIDDVRVYKRALSSSEITALISPDVTPPAISSVSASTTDSSATITWMTDEAATSTVNFGADASYGSASSSDVFATAHTIMLIGLNPSTTYHFQTVSTDASGNTATSSDLTFTTSAAPDTTAPIISSVTSSTTNATALIDWNTDEAADSVVFYGTASGTYTASSSDASLSTSHSLDLNVLLASTTYYYVTSSTDAAGNTATSSEQSFTTSATPDTTAPAISAVTSTSTQTTATITWMTDEAASSTLEYGTDASYGLASSSDEFTTSHTITLAGLAAGTTYHFRVLSADVAGNATTSADYTFATAAPAPQVISSIATSTTATTATINWTTGGTAVGATRANHSITLTGLSPLTSYQFKVTYADDAGNAATSTDVSFTTTQ